MQPWEETSFKNIYKSNWPQTFDNSFIVWTMKMLTRQVKIKYWVIKKMLTPPHLFVWQWFIYFVGNRWKFAHYFFIWPHIDRLERCGAQATTPVQDSLRPHTCIWSLWCWDCGRNCCQQDRGVLHSGQHSQPGGIHQAELGELSWDSHKSVCAAHQEASAARIWQRCHQAAGLN